MRSEKHHVLVKHPAEEVWRVWIKNFQVSLPKLVPQHYSTIEYMEGPPLAPGGVVFMTYNSASFPHFDYMKMVWDAIDHEKYYTKVRIIEGGHLGKHSGANCAYAVKLTPGPERKSCFMEWTFEFDDVSDKEFHQHLKEEMSIFGEAIESYISTKA